MSTLINAETNISVVSASALAELTPIELKSLTPTQLSALSAGQLSVFSAALVSMLPLKFVSPSALTGISTAEISGLAIKNLSISQVAALLPTQISTLTTQQVAALTTVQFAALTTEQQAALSDTGFTVLPSTNLKLIDFSTLLTSGIPNLTVQQMTTLTPQQIGRFTDGQISELSSAQVNALQAQQIAALSATQVTHFSLIAALNPLVMKTLKLDAFSSADITALSNPQAAYLTFANMAQLNSANVNGLTTTQLSAIKLNSLKGLTIAVIPQLTTDIVAVLTSNQLERFSTMDAGQLEAFTPAQVAQFSTTTKNWVVGKNFATISGATTVGSGIETSGTIIQTNATVEMIVAGGGNDTFHYDSVAHLVIDSIDGGTGNDDKLEIGGSIILTSLPNVANIEKLAAATNTATENNHSITLVTNFTTIDLSADSNVTSTAVIDLTNVTIDMTVKGVAAGSNTITGGAGSDVITGGASNDSIVGSLGSDSIQGNTGDDTISFNGAITLTNVVTIDGGAGNDSLIISGDYNFPDAVLVSIETLQTTKITGAILDLSLQTENLHIFGGAGSDTITSSAASDTIDAGAGNDVFIYLTNAALFADSVNGGDGDGINELNIGVNAVIFSILNSDDWSKTHNIESITAVANTANVSVSLDATAETAGIRKVDLSKVSGVSTIDVSEFTVATRLVGSTNLNTIRGGAGADTISSSGFDSIDGGSGFDILNFIDSNNVANDLDNVTNIEKIVISGTSATVTTVNNLVASGQTLIVDATALTGVLNWNGAAEIDDSFSILGGTGSDTIAGGEKNDVMTGNAGNDKFVFATADIDTTLGAVTDVITDFASGTDSLALGFGFGGTVDILATNEVATFTMSAFSSNIAGSITIGGRTVTYNYDIGTTETTVVTFTTLDANKSITVDGRTLASGTGGIGSFISVTNAMYSGGTATVGTTYFTDSAKTDNQIRYTANTPFQDVNDLVVTPAGGVFAAGNGILSSGYNGYYVQGRAPSVAPTATQIAAAFATGSTTVQGLLVSGALTGYTATAASDSNVIFTSATTGNVTDLTATTTGAGVAPTSPTITQGTSLSHFNYVEAEAAVTDLPTLLAAADTVLNGTRKYYVGQVADDSYLVTDTDGTGYTDVIQLTGVTLSSIAASDIIS